MPWSLWGRSCRAGSVDPVAPASLEAIRVDWSGGGEAVSSVLSRFLADSAQTTCVLEGAHLVELVPMVVFVGMLVPCLPEPSEIRRVQGHGRGRFPNLRLRRKGIAALSPRVNLKKLANIFVYKRPIFGLV